MSRWIHWLVAVATTAPLAGCGGDEPVPAMLDVTDITLSSLDPGVLLPGSTLVLRGGNFVPDLAGRTTLHLEGDVGGQRAHVALDARFLDYDRMEADWPGAFELGLPSAEGLFAGHAYVTATSSLDGLDHRSGDLAWSGDLRAELVPRLDSLQNEVLFVNDPVIAHGEDFLLGGSEGQSFAIVEGCFTEEGQTACTQVGPTEVGAEPVSPFLRDRVAFPFSPHIAGIKPGSFQGTMRLLNRHGAAAGGVEHTSDSMPTMNDIVEPVIFTVAPSVASLGEYVDVGGGGFVGTLPGEPDPTMAFTTIELDGTFTPEGGASAPISVGLIPQFENGQLVRYVINEEDALAQILDVRRQAGSFVGTARPVITFGPDSVTGSTSNVSFSIGHVKQVVFLRFLPSYVESLRRFGLRTLEARVRERVLDVVARDYGGVNIEFTTERPEGFALFSEVEIGGPDPNGIGLIGYDNTPGKDDGNLRLFDKIGGVNALTQLDGYPGYGGVFVESLFGFSQHPPPIAVDSEGADPQFDAIFDGLRVDVGGSAVSAAEIGAVAWRQDGGGCPAADRPSQIACAVFVLGSLIGTTVSHEVAHSLGLADPGGEGFHNTGDFPNALMDAGGGRPFGERAELAGEGPGSFCQVDYTYLRAVLPTSEPDPLATRQQCY